MDVYFAEDIARALNAAVTAGRFFRQAANLPEPGRAQLVALEDGQPTIILPADKAVHWPSYWIGYQAALAVIAAAFRVKL